MPAAASLEPSGFGFSSWGTPMPQHPSVHQQQEGFKQCPGPCQDAALMLYGVKRSSQDGSSQDTFTEGAKWESNFGELSTPKSTKSTYPAVAPKHPEMSRLRRSPAPCPRPPEAARCSEVPLASPFG